LLHSNFGCCIGTIQKSATYKISGALQRREVPKFRKVKGYRELKELAAKPNPHSTPQQQVA
jgi:hypothetical protein